MVESTQGNETPEGRQGSPTKFLIGGLVIVGVVAYLIISSIGGAKAYYLTVAELMDKGNDAFGTRVRVTGLVDGDSIDWDERNLDLAFDIVDDSGRLSVMYHGVRPDMFQDEAEAVVEGELNRSGVFEANILMLKCPSKYEEAATEQAPS